jgi:hypothetical protein
MLNRAYTLRPEPWSDDPKDGGAIGLTPSQWADKKLIDELKQRFPHTRLIQIIPLQHKYS